MIKTVSFAPPRSARAAAKPASKSSSQSAKAQPARATSAATVASKSVSKPAKTQAARSTFGSSAGSDVEAIAAPPRRRAASKTPVAPDETPAAEATVAPKITASKKTRAASSAPNTEVAAADAVPHAAKTPAKRAARKTVVAAEKAVIAGMKEAAPATVVAPAVAPKVKRSRAPKDLALQYGAAPEIDAAPRAVADKTAPRKRRTRAEKEARSQMIRPDDDVLQRLQQANAIKVQKPARRGRGWEFECGRCGRITRFQTPGAICECGAIAVRE